MPTRMAVKSSAEQSVSAELPAARIVMTGAANGSVTFKVSRLPRLDTAELAVSSGTWPNFRVRLPYSGVVWYLWASDDDGTIDKPAAVAVAGDSSNTTPATIEAQLGEQIAKILRDHKVGLEAQLHKVHPNCAIAFIQFGFGGSIERYPSIIVSEPTWTSQRVALPCTYERTFRLFIALQTAFSNDESDELRYATAFAGAVMDVLNYLEYARIDLPNGCGIYGGIASTGKAEVLQLGDRFIASANVVWTGNALITETGGGGQ
jgi:hypothetical protein